MSATATIDGRPVTPQRGETILAAARRLGIDVPTVCFRDGFPPEGGCRVCMVESGPARLAAAAKMRLTWCH